MRDYSETTEGVWNADDFKDYHQKWTFETTAGMGECIIKLTDGDKFTFIATMPSKNFHSRDMLEIIRKLNS